MANGDTASARGWHILSGVDDIREGYDDVNEALDDIAEFTNTGTWPWSRVSSKPSVFTPDDHSTDKLTSGTLPLERGGTNATSAAGARTALGIGSMATRAVTISTASPSGGSDGDIWLRYV